jgi:hypothetical protein
LEAVTQGPLQPSLTSKFSCCFDLEPDKPSLYKERKRKQTDGQESKTLQQQTLPKDLEFEMCQLLSEKLK